MLSKSSDKNDFPPLVFLVRFLKSVTKSLIDILLTFIEKLDAFEHKFKEQNGIQDVVDVWDDVEPQTSHAAKILNKDLYLTSVESNICELLERLIKIEMSPSDSLSYGGPTVIVIIMNKFKTNEDVMYECSKLMLHILEKKPHDAIVTSISGDSRYMRCIVRCMNQFPMNLKAQECCFRILGIISFDNSAGAKLLIDIYKRKGIKNDSQKYCEISSFGNERIFFVWQCANFRL